VETYQSQLDELNAQFKEELDALDTKIDPATEDLEKVTINPRKTDINVQLVALAWTPFRTDSVGQTAQAW
jgi:hypothetical protein